jgi:hypothetical protein
MRAYFLGCWNDLATIAQSGKDVSAARGELLEALDAQPAEIQAAVRPRLAAVARRSRVRHALRRQIGKSALLTRLEFERRRLREPRETLVRGDRAGFHNIVELARKLEQLPGLGRVDRIPGAIKRGAARAALCMT